MKRCLPGLLCLCLLLPAVPAGADELDAPLEEIRAGLRQKDPAAAVGALARLGEAVFRRLPFAAINVNLLAAPPEGFGNYLPRVDNLYRPGEPMILYVEPVGFKVAPGKEPGTFTYRLTADFNLVDAWGMVVGGRRGFGLFTAESRTFPDRLPLTFTYSLSGLPPGVYRVETMLRDELGQKSFTVQTEVRVAGH